MWCISAESMIVMLYCLLLRLGFGGWNECLLLSIFFLGVWVAV
jgi:hypothetical protein